MILVLVLSQIVASVIVASPLQAPSSVKLEDTLLLWSSSEENVTHTPLFKRFGESGWSVMTECERTTASSCNISALIGDTLHCCFSLSVRSQRGTSQSRATEACGTKEDRCTPTVDLAPVPGSAPGSGSLTVRLTRDHCLYDEYADHAQHLIQYWPQDWPNHVTELKSHTSQKLKNLDPGQTYCVQVRFYRHGPEGVPRCPVCVLIPRAPFKHAAVVIAVGISVVALLLGFAFVYVIIFHKKTVKNWFRPEPYPDCLTRPQEDAVREECCLTIREEERALITGLVPMDQDQD